MKRLPVLTPVLATLAPLPALALAAALLVPQPAQAEPVAKLIVSIAKIADHRGTLRLGLFDEAGYAADQAVAGADVVVTGDSVTATFEGLSAGRYGVKLFHDVNDNGKMDTNPFGMPVEPYAFSNNARGQFGPATWDAAAFEIAAGETTHAINLAQE